MTNSVLGVVGVVDAIAQQVRDDVFAGRLPAGSAVTEGAIASRFDVARPSAKAAIERLVAEGILERSAHRSARIPVLDAAAVHDIYQSRRRIEAEVLRELAERRVQVAEARRANEEIVLADESSPLSIVEPDMRFHTSMVDAIGSARTSRAYRSLVGEVRLCMAQVQGRGLLATGTIAAEHAAILDAVEAGEPARAVALLEQHLGAAERLLARAVAPSAP